LPVNRYDRLSSPDSNLRRPTLPTLRRYPTEPNQVMQARCASRTDRTNATEATSHNQTRAPVVLASMTTRRRTPAGDNSSPAPYAATPAPGRGVEHHPTTPERARASITRATETDSMR
jgi:hypothetical protein